MPELLPNVMLGPRLLWQFFFYELSTPGVPDVLAAPQLVQGHQGQQQTEVAESALWVGITVKDCTQSQSQLPWWSFRLPVQIFCLMCAEFATAEAGQETSGSMMQ